MVGSSLGIQADEEYLHYVFDLWVEAWRKKLGMGDVIVVRYADDRAPRAQRAEEGPMCVTA